PIPGNDDAIRAIALFLEVMAKAIIEGQSGGQASDVAFEDEDGEGRDSESAEPTDEGSDSDEQAEVEEVKEESAPAEGDEW
nr:30S ribosomal protein S2 [Spirochaetota bacterium]